jgi:molybdopterin-guanine dinucleotide biosynthesis protein A
MDARVLGVVLAGGDNRRYDGRPKALEPVGGTRIADRVIRALRQVVDRVVLVANDATTFGVLGLETRPDVRPGLGALGGIYTAVAWARDDDYDGALVTACDMPFLNSALLRALIHHAGADDVVAPQSASRRSVEPLCAYYGTGCLTPIERALERGERHATSFYSEVKVHTIPQPQVEAFGDPALLFMNVNSPEDHQRAEAAAREQGVGQP